MKKKLSSRELTRMMASIAIFGSLAVILYAIPIFQFKIPGFPPFLEIHLDEIPIFIAGYAYGPFASIFIIVLKTLIKLPMTSSLCIGELCDLILSLAFVLPSVILYRKRQNVKFLIIGLAISFVSQLITSSIITTFVIVPWFVHVMEYLSVDALVGMLKVFNKNVTNQNWQLTYAFLVALPFNAIKNAIVIAITVVSYFPLRTVIKKAREK